MATRSASTSHLKSFCSRIVPTSRWETSLPADNRAVPRILVLAALAAAGIEAQAACLVDKFEPAGADGIGRAVAISDKFFAFSASSSGEVYIYRPNGNKTKKLTDFGYITELEIQDNLLTAAGYTDVVEIVDVRDNFATETVGVLEPTSAAVRDDLLVIGSAYVDNPGGYANGKAAIFRLVQGTWQLEAQIQNADNHDFDIFGYRVKIHPDGRIFVGAIGAQLENGDRVGAVYEFTNHDGVWTQTEKITLGFLDELDFFGSDFAFTPDGSSLMIAAKGRKSVFAMDELGDTWGYNNEYPGSGTDYATNIAVNSDYMVVGAPYATSTGAVVVYRYDGVGWEEHETIEPGDGFPVDEFGYSVALSPNNRVLVGAPLHPKPGPGAVYLYELDCP